MEGQSESSTPAALKNHRVWTPTEDALLVQCLLDVIAADGKFIQKNFFIPGHLRTLEGKMEEKSPRCGIKGIPHIQSRLRTLKSNWQCVTVEPAVWDEYVRIKTKAAPWRNKSFPHYEALTQVWGKDRATGVEAVTGVDTRIPFSQNIEVPNEETTQEQEQVPKASSASRKWKRAASIDRENMAQIVQDMTINMDQSVKVVTKDLCQTIMYSSHAASNVSADLVVEELLKIIGLTEDELYGAHMKITSSPLLWRMFRDVPDESKANWVRKHV
ncbi:putative Myb/SANT-like domain-containing protein [Senna tora]|uniref:Putative Myb/SANT-like domain-containing protein n=1 Tax=Senna tora TaxID=362788 RepID=A0A834WCE5_9FABA|nr:putative Myb/SANT-like domain-containing protein [Senna tora]